MTNGTHGLNEKIIYSILYVVAIIAGAYTIYDILFGSINAVLINISISSTCILSYYFIKYKNAYQYIAIPTIFCIFSLCIFNFFLEQGFLSLSKMNFMIIGFVISLIFGSTTRILLLIIYTIVITILFYIQLAYPQLIVNLYQKESLSERLFDFTAYTILLVYLGIIIKKEYLKEKEYSLSQEQKLKKQKVDILEKHQEILSQQEELTTLNQQLEMLVEIRTKQLKMQNQQLNDYLDYNNSKIQVPLQHLNRHASQLSSLLKEGNTKAVYNNLDSIIKDSMELDKITKEINQILTSE